LVVGLLLDIELRKRTANTIGLIDVLKDLLAQCQKSGRGYAEGEIERTASRLAKSDLSSFFERALRSTDELQIIEQLAAGGILAEAAVSKSATLGIGWDLSQVGQAKIGIVAPQGPAAKAGLLPGDVILSVDGQPLEALLGGAFTTQKPGDTLRLTYQRSGVTQQATLTLGTEEATSFRLRPAPRPTTSQAGILAGLSGKPTL
jgi:predicted metalloprotease with PDZ domain